MRCEGSSRIFCKIHYRAFASPTAPKNGIGRCTLTLQPLSAFLGQKASAPAPEIEWPVWIDKVDRTADIFRYVNFMLPYTTPNVLDRPILERIAKIGIGPGKPWNLAELKPEIRLAIEDGVADALKRIAQTIPDVHDATRLLDWALVIRRN